MSAPTDAWPRYRRLLRIMLGVTAVAIVLALAWLKLSGTPMPLSFVLAVSVAIAGSLMLSAALMGLLFFSSTSGADEQGEDRTRR